MSITRDDRWVQTGQGQAVAGAEVYYLTQPADTDALTPLATVYSDLAGTMVAPNPQITDGLGHVGCYLDNSELYTVVILSPAQLLPQIYPDQALSGGGGGSSSTMPFALVPTGAVNGVNTTFTLPFVPGLLFLQQNLGTLIPGLGYTTAVVAGVFTITFAQAPETGDALFAAGVKTTSGTFGQAPAGAINGVNTTFTIAGLSALPRLLFLQNNNGMLVPAVGYTAALVGGVVTLTLTQAPETGDTLYVSGIV